MLGFLNYINKVFYSYQLYKEENKSGVGKWLICKNCWNCFRKKFIKCFNLKYKKLNSAVAEKYCSFQVFFLIPCTLLLFCRYIIFCCIFSISNSRPVLCLFSILWQLKWLFYHSPDSSGQYPEFWALPCRLFTGWILLNS